MAKRQMEEKNDTGLLTLMKDLLTVSFDTNSFISL